MRDHEEELEALGVRVLLLSFGQESQAARWIQETKAPFPLLLDPKRSVYRAYGLERSFTRVWNLGTVLLYLGLLLKGRKPRPIQGDPNQLGGDFIVDTRGIVRYAHPSEGPADRPSFQQIVEALKSIGDAGQEKPPL